MFVGWRERVAGGVARLGPKGKTGAMELLDVKLSCGWVMASAEAEGEADIPERKLVIVQSSLTGRRCGSCNLTVAGSKKVVTECAGG